MLHLSEENVRQRRSMLARTQQETWTDQRIAGLIDRVKTILTEHEY